MTTDRIKQQRQDIKNGFRLALASTRKQRRSSVISADYNSDRANVALSISKPKPVKGLGKAIATVEINGIGQLIRYRDRIDLKLRSTYRDHDGKAKIKFANTIKTKNMILDLGSSIDLYTQDLDWLNDLTIPIRVNGEDLLSVQDIAILYGVKLRTVASRIRYALKLVCKPSHSDVKSVYALPLSIEA